MFIVRRKEQFTKGNEHKIGRDGMRANQDFNYEPDKLAEFLVGEFDIDERLYICNIGIVSHL